MLVSILGSPDAMLRAVFGQAAAWGLPPDLLCDHMCYRVATLERYNELKQQLCAVGTPFPEKEISGRMIAIFTLHTPYIFEGREIRCVELPAPKAGSNFSEGWEHVEFVTGVLPGHTPQDSVEAFLARYPHLLVDRKGMNKGINPEAGVRVSPAYQFKLHPRPIWEVVALEGALPRP